MPAQRCPMCHLVHRSTAATCDGGHRAGADRAELPENLAHPLTRAWLAAAGGGLLVLTGVLLLLTYHAGVTLLVGGSLIMAWGIRTITAIGHGQRAFATGEPPRARVIRRR